MKIESLAAIDIDFLSGNEITQLGGQKDSRPRYVAGLAHAAKKIAIGMNIPFPARRGPGNAGAD